MYNNVVVMILYVKVFMVFQVKKINFTNEYSKIYETFNNDYIITRQHNSYSWSEFFEEFINEWKYKETYTTVGEILYDLGLGI